MSGGKTGKRAGGAGNRYRDTLFLPRTAFPMKAGLPALEEKLLARWERMDLYGQLRRAGRGREKFVLHDGPPYANGAIHAGTALNKILKDFVNRSQQMMGRDAVYVPGWDCHGLPIEWQVEEGYRARGRKKPEIARAELRRACRAFASRWMEVQRAQFQRLGVAGDWAHPYTTMDFEAEGGIVAEFLKFAMDGSLYRGLKPVMWSVVEQTALAEAEIEYRPRVSPALWVRFPVIEGLGAAAASAVIWTTTPWTLPGNRAVAFSPALSYGLYRVRADAPGQSLAQTGEVVILADALAGAVARAAGLPQGFERISDAPELAGLVCAHPLRGAGYEFDVPLLAADFVTAETGTGLVHIAPGHGRDDFELGRAHGLDLPETLDADSAYTGEAPGFAGLRVLDARGGEGPANARVCEALRARGRVLAQGALRHDYPHSWRSKAPVLFRATAQWFISMEKTGLRRKALAAIDAVRWHPASAGARIRAMVENRPDWVVSRQRVWGVPLTLFVKPESGEILRDPQVNARIVAAVKQDGADAWFERPARAFLGEAYREDAWEKVEDILDVWFDSGSSHALVLEPRADLRWPASLYLEGSDQHRGWFQSSLLESCATRGRAPYEAVLTHGFVLNAQGRKMSKSEGAAISPQKICGARGADILRLWAALSDYGQDVRIGEENLAAAGEAYRKLRNGLRFLLGNLSHCGAGGGAAVAESRMPELERLMLHYLFERRARVEAAYAGFDFKSALQEILSFTLLDLSSFYFDIRKDALYCDPASSLRRRSACRVLDHLFCFLTAWLAPLLCFTAEEAWSARGGGDEADSVHLRLFPQAPAGWHDPGLGEKWERVRRVRRVISGALEIERKAGRIGASLDAAPEIYIADPDLLAELSGLDLAEIAITSQASLKPGRGPAGAFRLSDVPAVAVAPRLAQGRRCARSWKILPEVGADPAYPDVSRRDAAALAERAAADG